MLPWLCVSSFCGSKTFKSSWSGLQQKSHSAVWSEDSRAVTAPSMVPAHADQATTPNATWIYIFYCNPCTSCIAGVQVRRHALPSPAPGGCVVEWCQSLREMYIGCKCTVVTVVHFLLPQVRKSCKSKAWLVEASKLASCALWSFTDFECQWCQWCQWCHFPIWAPGVFPHVCHSPWPALHWQLELRVAKAWTSRGLRLELQSCNWLQLAATIKTPEPVFISFPYFSFTCRLVGIGSRAWREIGLPQVRMAERLKFEWFPVCRQGQQSPVNSDRLCGTSLLSLNSLRRGEKTGQLEVVDFITVGAEYRTCSVLQPWQKWTVFNRWSVWCRDWVHLGRHALELALLRKELEICRSEAAAQIQAPGYRVRLVTLLPNPFGSGTPWRAPEYGTGEIGGAKQSWAKEIAKFRVPWNLRKKARCQKHTAFTAAVRQASYQVWARPSSARLLRWILQKSIGLAILGSRKTWFPNRHVYCLPESKTSFCHSWSAMAVDKTRLQKWVFSQANSNIVKRTWDVRHSWKEPALAREMAAEDRQWLLRFTALLWFQLCLTLIWR